MGESKFFVFPHCALCSAKCKVHPLKKLREINLGTHKYVEFVSCFHELFFHWVKLCGKSRISFSFEIYFGKSIHNKKVEFTIFQFYLDWKIQFTTKFKRHLLVHYEPRAFQRFRAYPKLQIAEGLWLEYRIEIQRLHHLKWWRYLRPCLPQPIDFSWPFRREPWYLFRCLRSSCLERCEVQERPNPETAENFVKLGGIWFHGKISMLHF